MIYQKKNVMAKKPRQKTYKAEVIDTFKKRSRDGTTIKEYKVGDIYYSTDLDSIEYLKSINKLKK